MRFPFLWPVSNGMQAVACLTELTSALTFDANQVYLHANLKRQIVKREIHVNPIVKSFQYGQHTVTLETGVMARQATAAVMVSMDDTCVFVTVVGKKEADHGRDFFPADRQLSGAYLCCWSYPGWFLPS